MAAGEERRPELRECHLWICVGGQGSVDGAAVGPGDVWMVGEGCIVRAETAAAFLRT